MINMKDSMPEFMGKRVLFRAPVLVKKKLFVFIDNDFKGGMWIPLRHELREYW